MPHKRKQLSPKLRLKIVRKFKFRCYYCGKKFENVINPYGYLWCYPYGQNPIHIDHVVPICLGGVDDEENLVFSLSTM